MAAGNKKDKMATAKELRALSVDELNKKLVESREELMRSRFRHAAATLENTSLLKKLRRSIARMETVLIQKAQRG